MDVLIMELQFVNGKRHWWTAATDLGWEGVWKWMGNGQTWVGDFVWDKASNEPNGGIGSDCMLLNYQEGYLGWDVSCTRTDVYPACQIQL